MYTDKCEVTWNNLQLATKDGKKIISNASGQLKPSTITAVLGPSGSGKSSLMNSIAGRISSKLILTGDIKANSENRNIETWPRTVAYMVQRLNLYEWDTVYETLEFGAKLKLPNQKNAKAKVEELIDILGLREVENTFICKLSGGERVRVSLGLELLGDPLVILVDEPLSGLDSHNAINILEILRKIANLGKTVMLTIHQPSYEMMNYFDNIMLMCQGNCIYEGTLSNCIKFFEECGYELPKNTTPTDFFLNILSVDSKNQEQKIESLKRINMISREWNFLKKEHEMTIRGPIAVQPAKKSVSNFKILFLRSCRNYIRNSEYWKSKTLQKIVMAFVFGITFYNTGLENADVFTFRGIVSYILQSVSFGVSSPIMSFFIEERKTIARECMSGMYKAYEIYLIKFISDSIFNYAYDLPYHFTIYFMIGFPFDLRVLSMHFLIIASCISYSVSFGLLISVIARTPPSAQILGVTINILFMLYSGSLSNLETLSKYVAWICKFSPAHYCFRALVRNLLSYLPYKSTSQFNKVSNPLTMIIFGLDGMGTHLSLSILWCFTLTLLVIGAYLLHRKTNNNLNIKKLKNGYI